ncbi:MAG: hypothetical protein OD811_05450 [Alphaproteobacteria bacterium]
MRSEKAVEAVEAVEAMKVVGAVWVARMMPPAASRQFAHRIVWRVL